MWLLVYVSVFSLFRVELQDLFLLVVQGFQSLQPESDDCLQLGDDLWPHPHEVTRRDRGCHDEH